MNTSRYDQLREYVTQSLQTAGIENTPTNRLDCLEWLRADWEADPEINPEKSAWLLTIAVEIMLTKVKIAIQ